MSGTGNTSKRRGGEMEETKLTLNLSAEELDDLLRLAGTIRSKLSNATMGTWEAYDLFQQYKDLQEYRKMVAVAYGVRLARNFSPDSKAETALATEHQKRLYLMICEKRHSLPFTRPPSQAIKRASA
ncbi:hypothetical protein AWENTII_002398 [Aspergillus wentii]|nr:hypothetical protein MW887_008008 [Aspergillus wentii]